MTAKTIDVAAILKAADDLEAVEATLQAQKDAMKKPLQSALVQRRAQIADMLNLKEFKTTYYNNKSEAKGERRYILDRIAKAHASGIITIPGLGQQD